MRTFLCMAAVLAIGAAAHPAALDASLDQQTDVAVTVYNGGVALVRDVRALRLPEGELSLHFKDVAEQIRPETVSLRSLAREGSMIILEQNYEYDLISPEKLLEKYVGRRVEVRDFDRESDLGLVDATLLSVHGGPVFQLDDKIYLGLPGTVVLPELPENLIARPSLIWLLENGLSEQEIEVSYLTRGIDWRADYVLSLSRDETAFDLSGWVTMDNRSGAAYVNAQLKLVAGDVNIVRERKQLEHMGYVAADVRAMAAPMPEQESFAEFHLYTMPRRTTIRQNQQKQLALLNATGAACQKRYEFRGHPHFFAQSVARQEAQPVDVFLEFMNEEDNALGMPLPGGVVRVYQEDRQSMLQFAGEDRIQHTPKDERVRLRLGRAFDVVADRIQREYRRITNQIHESDFEIEVRNRKDTPVTVHVMESLPGDWEIRDATHPYTRRDARTAEFALEVPAGGETVLTYTMRVRM